MTTKLSISLAAIAAFTGSAFAGTHVTPVTPPAPDSLYRAGEFSLSVAGLVGARAGGLNALSAWSRNAVPGVDMELKYFITRNFGLGLEGDWLNTRRTLFGSALNFYYRMPLSESSAWAPYFLGGIGGLYGGGGGAAFEGHLGAGVEYRLSQKIGLFTDGRYTWVDATRNTIPQFGLIRFGVNFVF